MAVKPTRSPFSLHIFKVVASVMVLALFIFQVQVFSSNLLYFNNIFTFSEIYSNDGSICSTSSSAFSPVAILWM